jgi:hypothetical protein
MIHLNTYNTSYGWKKGLESKCQFDFQPLKVKNHLELGVCKGRATYLLETTWKQAKNESFKVHEMEQLYY